MRVGLTAPCDADGLGEHADPQLLQRPAEIDDLGPDRAPADRPQHAGVALLQRDDLGHPPHVAWDVLGQAVEPVLDRPHVAVDVGQAPASPP